MNLRQLKYFATVVELGSITRAAAALRIAQPALGTQIRQLEGDLGVDLLLRHARGVKVTKAGSTLYEKAVDILRSVEEVRRTMAEMRGLETIKLGLTPSLMSIMGESILVEFKKQAQSVDLQISQAVSATLIGQIKRREIDLALVYGVSDEPSLNKTRLYDEELYFVIHREKHARGRHLSLKDALQTELAIQTEQSAIYHILLDAAVALQVTPNVTFTTRSTRGILELVSHGLATGILPASSIASAVKRGEITAIGIENPKVYRTLYLVLREGEQKMKNDSRFEAFLEDLLRRNGRAWFGPLPTGKKHPAL